jgi:hypothetical protein
MEANLPRCKMDSAVTHTNQALRTGEPPAARLGNEATLAVEAGGREVRGALHADPAMLIALIALAALTVAGIALYVVLLTVRKLK